MAGNPVCRAGDGRQLGAGIEEPGGAIPQLTGSEAGKLTWGPAIRHLDGCADAQSGADFLLPRVSSAPESVSVNCSHNPASGWGNRVRLESGITLNPVRIAFPDKFLDAKLTTLFELVRIKSLVVNADLREGREMKAKIKSETRRKIILDGYVNNEPLKDIAAKIGCSLASLKVSASNLGCTRTPKDAAAFRRGFRLPEHMRDDYYQLMVAGKYRAHECALILGLYEPASKRSQ
ncbi:hypothetical protein ACG873_01785 (plasmid) [Mesorhizobium sp. AaZ16]|uniref:hypothetical protein n=1 Tax=Mesorhizobium sp. AaZ16 TaxID=3402289 RepID=UPI00374E2E62